MIAPDEKDPEHVSAFDFMDGNHGAGDCCAGSVAGGVQLFGNAGDLVHGFAR